MFFGSLGSLLTVNCNNSRQQQNKQLSTQHLRTACYRWPKSLHSITNLLQTKFYLEQCVCGYIFSYEGGGLTLLGVTIGKILLNREEISQKCYCGPQPKEISVSLRVCKIFSSCIAKVRLILPTSFLHNFESIQEIEFNITILKTIRFVRVPEKNITH